MGQRDVRGSGRRALFVVCIALFVITSSTPAAFAAVPGTGTGESVGTAVPGAASDVAPDTETLDAPATLDAGPALDAAAIDTGATLDAGTVDAVTADAGTVDAVMADAAVAPQVGFGVGGLAGTALTNPTSLQFGPDGRLYVAVQSGEIYAYTIARNGANDYVVTDTEVITAILDLPNHDDDGTPNPSVTERLITGIYVTGTAANPVVYVSSSDPRIGGGDSGTDTNLDTNSGIISRLTWDGAGWDHFQVVRGLPRNEENHATNGLQIDPATGTLYAAMGGNTNKGAPSNNFAYQPEYALSAAILAVDLDDIGETTYDVPTLRGGSTPFGGDGGANMGVLTTDGPVQIYSPGYRNPYDIVLTEAGRMYTVDNGANSGWGGTPVGDGTSACTNQPNELDSGTQPDSLHYVSGEGYYGGHPAPVRANPDGAGFYAPDGTLMVDYNASYTPVPLSMANPVECTYRPPGPDVSAGQNGALATFQYSTNGIEEYTALNFDGAMQGDLLTASFSPGGPIWRLALDAAGDEVTTKEPLFSNFGSLPLDVTAQGPGEVFPGTVWAATYGGDDVTVFEPNDYGGGGATCTAADDPALDEDGDGYDNADELVAGTDPCSAASKPPDADGDFDSDATDPDDDNDGTPDTTDPFALDPDDGLATTAPVELDFTPGSVPGTLLDLGFTGIRTNGVDYAALYDPEALTAGGAANVLSIDEAGEGSAEGGLNTGTQAFQFGVAPGSDPLVVESTLQAPFPASDAGVTPVDFQSQGVFVGTGDQDNYVALRVTANGGAGGVELLAEREGSVEVVGSVTDGAIVGDGVVVDLSLTVHPETGAVTGSYAVAGGERIPVGSTTVPLAWTAGTDQGLAVGVAATSRGPGGTFPATWSDLSVTKSADSADGEATLAVLAGESNVDASTWAPGSFTVANTGGQAVESVTLDLRSTVLPDMVYDPLGTAGDTVAKAFTVDSGVGTGYAGYSLSVPHDGVASDGYDALSVTFDDFDPGETFAFSIDVDPTSIQGSAAPGPGESGSVSGLELAGATVTVTFADGSTHVGTLASDGSAAGAVAVVDSTVPDAPSIDPVAVDESTTLSPVHTATTVTTPAQTVSVSGPAGATVRLLQVEAGLFTDGLPGGGFDIEAYEANSAVGVEETLATVGPDGTVDVDLTLAPTDGESDLTYVVAVVDDGDAGRTSNVVVFEHDPDATTPSATFTVTPSDPETGEPVTFDASGSYDPDGTIVAYDWTFGDGSAGVSETASRIYVDAGTYTVELTVTDDSGETDTATATVVVAPAESIVAFALNAGGGSYMAADGVVYEADTAYSGGQTYADGTAAIVGTSDDTLYQSERYGTFSYAIPVADGEYTVTLQFAEVWWTSAGQRVFDVTAEGATVVDDLDLYVAAGHDVAYDAVVTTTVSDGTLNLGFAGSVDSAKVNAVRVESTGSVPVNDPPTAAFTTTPAGVAVDETVAFDASDSTDADGSITSYDWTFGDGTTATGETATHAYAAAGTYTVELTVTDDEGATDTTTRTVTVTDPVGSGDLVFAVNAGGGLYTADDGTVYAADTGFSGGQTYADATAAIAGTTDDALYQSERYGSFSYAVPVADGTYAVTLQFAEIWWTVDSQRVFDVTAEGTTVVDDLDLYAAAGHDTAYDAVVTVAVTDGTLDLGLVGSVDNAKVNAVRVEAVDGQPVNQPPTASFTVTPTDPTAGEAVAFDASGSFDPDGSVVAYEWTFGDGSAGVSETTSHTYASAGTYTVELTVTDDDGETATTTETVTVTDSTANLPPTASFTVSPSGPAVDESVAFDAAGSTDGDGTIASYAWTFGDGTTATGVTPVHTYTSAGTYTVELTVTDDGGATDTTTQTVTVTEPVTGGDVVFAVNAGGASYTASDGTVYEADTAYSGGNLYSDPSAAIAGTTDDALYQSERYGSFSYAVPVADGTYAVTLQFAEIWWTSDGQRVFDVTAEGATVVDDLDLYATAGHDTAYDAVVTVTVTDGTLNLGFAGSVNNAKINAIRVESTDSEPANQPPTASFTVSPSEPEVDGSVVVDASGSSDTDGTIASYAWDLGDGTTASGTTAAHAYTAAGTYTVQLTVTDDDGATDTTTQTVTVTDGEPANQPPTASFTVSSASPTVGETVTVDAAGSTDSDGTIASYDWTFGDGATASGTTGSYAYSTAGTYTVELTVTDDDGATDTATQTVTVNDPTTNGPPTASFTVSPTEPAVDESVAFDASGSTDADGTVASYAWDFGDGTTASGATSAHVYTAAGTYTVELTVTDDDGATDTTTQTVTVTEAGPAPGEVVFAVNAGGGSYTASDGTVYAADTGFSGGQTYADGTAAIAGTTDDTLYQSERYGDFGYAADVADGTYEVTLQFAEIWWTSASQRVFDATVEGSPAVTNLDIYAAAGHDAAYEVTVTVTVTDGTLDLSFTGDVENAKLSAVRVTAV